jgi:predicted permease
MTSIGRDIQQAFRLLAKNPGMTVVAVLALALGIGALTVTFSVTNAYLLRPLPFRSPDRLVHLWSTNERQGLSMLRVSVPDFLDWRAQNTSFEDLAAFNYTGDDLTGGDRPEKISTGRVSANVFDVLGVEPVLGRGFRRGEDAPGRPPVVVLSFRFWQTRFRGDPGILGRAIELNRQRYEIVGVMPADFVFPLPTTQLWTTRELDPGRYGRKDGVVQVVGRLKPGVTPSQAQAEMSGIADRLAGAYPEADTDRGVAIVPLRAALNFGYDIFRLVAVVLGVADLFVLLIACANVASLLLGRALGRRREVAIRKALGATRARLVRQFLIESLVLALAGGAVGVLLAAWGVRAMGAAIPDELYRVGDISIDGRALVFSLAATIGTAVIFGLLPALSASRRDPGAAMREDVRSMSTAGSTLRAQSALVAGEIGVAVMLLVGTALMIHSYENLQRLDPGFDPRHVLTATISLPPRYDAPEKVAAFHRAVIESVRSVPGVTAAATVDYLPLNHETDITEFTLPGRDVAATGKRPSAVSLVASPDYFSVMGVPILAGRAFSDADRAGAARVAVVNRTMARRYLSDADAVGRTIALEDGELVTIVGVASDAKHDDLAAPPGAQIFFPQAQQPTRYLRVLARTDGDPLARVASVSAAVWRVDRDLPLVDIRSLTQVVHEYLLPQTAMSSTLAGLAAGALALAVVGVYGLMAFFVTQRTSEIGIRVALGAAPRDVIAMVMKRGVGLTLAGVGAGLLGAVGLAQVMSSLLFGLSPIDPFSFGAVPAILVVVALVSCYLPARRAAAVDPLVSLRCE